MSTELAERRGFAKERTLLSDPYFEMEVSGQNDPWKQPQRHRILEFILDFHPHGFSNLHFFGFPSAWWKFEHMLMGAWHRQIRFTGIERSWQVLEHGVRHMPGIRKQYRDWNLFKGECSGWESDISRVVCFHAEHFWGIGHKFKLGKSARLSFASMFKGWTCAWIDSWYPIRGVYRESLRRIGGHFAIGNHSFPLAISFPIGRDECAADDGETSLESRVRVVAEELSLNNFRRFQLIDSFEYRRDGANVMGMGTALGLMVPKVRGF